MTADQIIAFTLLAYFSAFWVLLFGRNLFSENGVSAIAVSLNLFGLISALYFLKIYQGDQVVYWKWVRLGYYQFFISILINKLTLMMWVLVQFISLLVQLFSTKYMKGDSGYARYFAFLQLFLFSMLGLIASGSLIFTFIFWELVGFSSWLLIGFWYQKETATLASLKAFLYNRIGDAAFLIGIGLLFALTETLDYVQLKEHLTGFLSMNHESLNLSGERAENYLTLIGLLLFGGCVGKSAQFPLQVWLPEAMEGPTPVSALIHAATMVAAGIFLLARLEFIFTPDAGTVIAVVGALTAILAAWSAVFQNDIKKVLAYSTISQLGLMVMAAGAGAVNASLFHLLTHAAFKAGLFLAAGAIIYHFHHEQDMRKMGGYFHQNPVIGIAYTICALALAGLPLFSGFLSKDAVLIATYDWALSKNNFLFMLIPISGILASLLTSWYITRQWVLVMWPREESAQEKREIKFGIFEICISILALFSIWIWFAKIPLDFRESHFFRHFPIGPSINHWLGYILSASSVVLIFFSFRYYQKPKAEKELGFMGKLGLNHFYIESFYSQSLIRNFCGFVQKIRHPDAEVLESIEQEKHLAKYIYRFDSFLVDGFVHILTKLTVALSQSSNWLDNNLVDGVVKATSALVNETGGRLKEMQGGRIQQYLLVLVLLILLIVLILNLL